MSVPAAGDLGVTATVQLLDPESETLSPATAVLPAAFVNASGRFVARSPDGRVMTCTVDTTDPEPHKLISVRMAQYRDAPARSGCAPLGVVEWPQSTGDLAVNIYPDDHPELLAWSRKTPDLEADSPLPALRRPWDHGGLLSREGVTSAPSGPDDPEWEQDWPGGSAFAPAGAFTRMWGYDQCAGITEAARGTLTARRRAARALVAAYDPAARALALTLEPEGAELEVSVDGGAFADYTGPIAVEPEATSTPALRVRLKDHAGDGGVKYLGFPSWPEAEIAAGGVDAEWESRTRHESLDPSTLPLAAMLATSTEGEGGMSLRSFPHYLDLHVFEGEATDPREVVALGRRYAGGSAEIAVEAGQVFTVVATDKTADPLDIAAWEADPGKWLSLAYRVRVPPPKWAGTGRFGFWRLYAYNLPPFFPCPVRFDKPGAPPPGWYAAPGATGSGDTPDDPGDLQDCIFKCAESTDPERVKTVYATGGDYVPPDDIPAKWRPKYHTDPNPPEGNPSSYWEFFRHFVMAGVTVVGGYSPDFKRRDIDAYRTKFVRVSVMPNPVGGGVCVGCWGDGRLLRFAGRGAQAVMNMGHASMSFNDVYMGVAWGHSQYPDSYPGGARPHRPQRIRATTAYDCHVEKIEFGDIPEAPRAEGQKTPSTGIAAFVVHGAYGDPVRIHRDVSLSYRGTQVDRLWLGEYIFYNDEFFLEPDGLHQEDYHDYMRGNSVVGSVSVGGIGSYPSSDGGKTLPGDGVNGGPGENGGDGHHGGGYMDPALYLHYEEEYDYGVKVVSSFKVEKSIVISGCCNGGDSGGGADGGSGKDGDKGDDGEDQYVNPPLGDGDPHSGSGWDGGDGGNGGNAGSAGSVSRGGSIGIWFSEDHDPYISIRDSCSGGARGDDGSGGNGGNGGDGGNGANLKIVPIAGQSSSRPRGGHGGHGGRPGAAIHISKYGKGGKGGNGGIGGTWQAYDMDWDTQEWLWWSGVGGPGGNGGMGFGSGGAGDGGRGGAGGPGVMGKTYNQWGIGWPDNYERIIDAGGGGGEGGHGASGQGVYGCNGGDGGPGGSCAGPYGSGGAGGDGGSVSSAGGKGGDGGDGGDGDSGELDPDSDFLGGRGGNGGGGGYASIWPALVLLNRGFPGRIILGRPGVFMSRLNAEVEAPKTVSYFVYPAVKRGGAGSGGKAGKAGNPRIHAQYEDGDESYDYYIPEDGNSGPDGTPDANGGGTKDSKLRVGWLKIDEPSPEHLCKTTVGHAPYYDVTVPGTYTTGMGAGANPEPEEVANATWGPVKGYSGHPTGAPPYYSGRYSDVDGNVGPGGAGVPIPGFETPGPGAVTPAYYGHYWQKFPTANSGGEDWP